ncbi:hypothetical protein Gasu2_23180 [Galdieria sulphuraria]|uniref:Transmembrane protein n=1 Tax=Galdieria sulphuraria TaxID=130081 RepID=M2Y1A5_GALSU|nr:uncharacterized protein Gasu_29290 [Galdieria sulphuraria]EME29708.1 hypothetical protein Gasu_29290 [Galdieria sulphuraria]GJD08003.1 hypothetical protein Gasu2_23180 [Galdieria sulphuraria]|eukprot:XP_005706228.1 hypothetical protein Gasu_29290 [Galdieria sulphuraria]
MLFYCYGYLHPIQLRPQGQRCVKSIYTRYSCIPCFHRRGLRTSQLNRLGFNSIEILASHQEKDPEKSTSSKFFALETNGDVLKLGAVVTGCSFLCYLLLQHVFQLSEQTAGLVTTGLLSVFGMGIWTLSYFARVANKEMTYVQQLKDYEDKVLQKRLDELSETELQSLLDELKEKPPGITK